MRWMLLLTLLAMSFDARAATDTAPEPRYEKRLDQENLAFLKRLSEQLDRQGYRQVRIIPQLFVAKMIGPDGKEHTLIVNSDTLETFTLDTPLPFKEAVLGGPLRHSMD